MLRILVTAIFICACVGLAGAADLPGQGADAQETVIYRDTWGIPHIYAPTEEAGLYAQGYAVAQDRPEQLLLNLMAAVGRLSQLASVLMRRHPRTAMA